MAEVEAGKLAQSKATGASVKTFAQQMVTDHSKANDQLKQIALGKGIMLPTGPDRSHARDLEKAGKLEGAEFDRQYMKMMVSDHKKTVSLFEKEAKNGKDPELKSFASTMLPDLQKHLQMAQSTESEVKKAR
jgi:putative membrane protein